MSRHIAIVIVLFTFSVSICFATKPSTHAVLNVQKLREAGPPGLEVALSEYDLFSSQIVQPLFGAMPPLDQGEIADWEERIDQIAGQRHATVSRLYWFTDLQRAKQHAAAENKPILSLRMLGNLTDEFSCANSRFFRTALYANQEISNVLREKFILHWKSVRPVPKVTIDFGDGRKIERTITGNSAHYVLDVDGRPLEVLPGLYSPKEFLNWLELVEALFNEFNSLEETEQDDFLADYHRQRGNDIQVAWQSDIKEVAPELLEYGPYPRSAQENQNLVFVDADEAARLAFSKMRVELPIIRAIKSSPQKMDSMVSDTLWQRLASLSRGETKLDSMSVALMRRLNPNAFQAGELAFAKSFVEDPILRMVRNFEDSISLDTVRNEYLLHRQIHSWFANGEASRNLDELNERVYAELFLTPSSDPWLGLVPPDSYAALEGGGVKIGEITIPSPR